MSTTKEATSQKPSPYGRVFCKGREWSLPKTTFVVFTLGKTYSPEEKAEFEAKVNAWSKQGDEYVVEMHGLEIVVVNATLLEGRVWEITKERAKRG